MEKRPEVAFQSSPSYRKILQQLGFKKKEAIEYICSKKYTLDVLQGKIKYLKEKGFSKPIKLIEKHPQILGVNIDRALEDLRKAGFSEPDAVKVIEKSPKIIYYNLSEITQKLRRAKFSDPIKLIIKYPRIVEYAAHLYIINTVIENLKQAGFSEPIQLIERHPRIVTRDINKVIKNLRKAGFSDPVKLIKKFPPIANRNIPNLIKKLKNLNFSDPVRLIEKHPSAASRNIKKLIKQYERAGFSDPINLLERCPRIISININKAIKNLRKAGFSDPVKLIKKFPPIATISIEKLKRFLGLVKKLNKRFNLEYDPIKVIENFPRHLSLNVKRVFFYLRIAAFFNLKEGEYRMLNFYNPFLVFFLLKQNILDQQPPQLLEFRNLLSELEKLGQEKESKERIINETKSNLENYIKKIYNLLGKEPHNPNYSFLLKLALSLKSLQKNKKES